MWTRGLYLGLVMVLVWGVVSPCLGESGEAPRIGIKLFTPEPGGAIADRGYLIQWKDSENPGYTIRLYRLDGTGQRELINGQPVDASASGFAGNKYLWHTSGTPQGLYRVSADLVDPNGQVVALSTSDGYVQIRHERPVPGQQIYVYAFVHLKNQFIMGSERDGIARILEACRTSGYRPFEFTFNWPIAWYLQNGVPDDRPGHQGRSLFDPDPNLIEQLKAHAQAGGAIGCYDPLSGWHYRNIWFEHPDLLDKWYALGTKAIGFETSYQDQITGDIDRRGLGSKRYLDRLFGRQTVELAGNLPVVCYHVTKLLGNRVLAQWSPHTVGDIGKYRFIQGRDYWDGRFACWYLGQLAFSHYPAPADDPQAQEDTFLRQIPMLGAGKVYDPCGLPLDDPRQQSIQQWVDTAISGIRANRIPKDILYIFEHGISLQNTEDAKANWLQQQLVEAGFDWLGGWSLVRLAHMNCAPELRLPKDYWDYQFRPDYQATQDQMALSGQIVADAFEYVRYLAQDDPNIHLVTGDDLYDHVLVQEGMSVTSGTLGVISRCLLDNLARESWLSHVRLPAYVTLGSADPNTWPASGRYYSLAETFKMLTDALTDAEAGAIAPEVHLAYVLGPTELARDIETLAQGRSFTVDAIIHAARGMDLKDPLADTSLWPQGIVPGISYQVPSYVTIGSAADPAGMTRVNAAEFLILMAKAFLALQQGRPSEMVKAEPARPLNEWAYKIQTLDGGYNPSSVNVYQGPKGKFYFNHIQLWTFKPAQFKD